MLINLLKYTINFLKIEYVHSIVLYLQNKVPIIIKLTSFRGLNSAPADYMNSVTVFGSLIRNEEIIAKPETFTGAR